MSTNANSLIIAVTDDSVDPSVLQLALGKLRDTLQEDLETLFVVSPAVQKSWINHFNGADSFTTRIVEFKKKPERFEMVQKGLELAKGKKVAVMPLNWESASEVNLRFFQRLADDETYLPTEHRVLPLLFDDSVQADNQRSPAIKSTVTHTSVQGVTIHNFVDHPDWSGTLIAAELASDLPFAPARYFIVHSVPDKHTVRGEHAHKKCKQFLTCISGAIQVVADDGKNREAFELSSPNRGIFLPPMTWGAQLDFTTDAVLLVFASDPYDAGDYVRNYDEFLELVRS